MIRKTTRNPVTIKFIEQDEFEISIELDNWKVSKLISRKALIDLQSQINDFTGLKKISESFDCNGEQAQQIQRFWEMKKNWSLCQNCAEKWKSCFDCVIKCDSPLERTLLLELRKQNIPTVMQRRINKDGSFYEFPTKLDFKNLLTVPDFFIENKESKLCIYADGHTYHERTEQQALRDKNIDRSLQKLGYKVLRYTGKEIRSDSEKVVKNIQSYL